MLSSSPASSDRSFVFYLYGIVNAPEFKASASSKRFVLHENLILKNFNLFEKVIVYLSPSQLHQLPLYVKTNQLFMDFLKFGSLMIRTEDLPQDASPVERETHVFDSRMALVILQNLTEIGYAPAQRTLGACYNEGWGVKEDKELSLTLYFKSALQWYAPAQLHLGTCYEYGTGVEQDFAKAAVYFQQAAAQGMVLGQYNLGLCFARGRSVAQDFAMAAKYFRLVADHGMAQAQYYLAVYLEKGQGVEQDLEEAAKYYKLAADQGHELAKIRLKDLEARKSAPLPDAAPANPDDAAPRESVPRPARKLGRITHAVLNRALKKQEDLFEEKMKLRDAMYFGHINLLYQKYAELVSCMLVQNHAAAAQAIVNPVNPHAIILPPLGIRMTPAGREMSLERAGFAERFASSSERSSVEGKRNNQDDASQAKRSRSSKMHLESIIN